MSRRAAMIAMTLAALTTRAAAMEETEPRFLFFQADRFEVRAQDGDDVVSWDAQGWYGGDEEKLWLKSEGKKITGGKLEDAEAQVLYSRMVTDFFDVQTGLRYDARPGPRRGYAVLGMQGLAPYYLQLDGALFLSNHGELSARLTAEYELLLSQRLILQPAFEVNLAARDVKQRGVGSGVNDVELGLRLRYEFRRELAPYIGVTWQRTLGESADLARKQGEDVEIPALVAGIRFWF